MKWNTDFFPLTLGLSLNNYHWFHRLTSHQVTFNDYDHRKSTGCVVRIPRPVPDLVTCVQGPASLMGVQPVQLGRAFCQIDFTTGLMLWCCHLELLNHFLRRASHSHFAWAPQIMYLFLLMWTLQDFIYLIPIVLNATNKLPFYPHFCKCHVMRACIVFVNCQHSNALVENSNITFWSYRI